MDRLMGNLYSQHEMPEGDRMDTGHREMTSEDVRRETFNAPQQKSICGSNTSEESLFLDVLQRLAQVEKECSVNRSWRVGCETRLQVLEKRNSASSGSIIQKEAPEKEECEKLKEKVRDLEARNQKLLSKALSMHKQSENMNDPFRLSAVLEMFKKVKLQDWGRCWSSSARWSYPRASQIIKKLFDACERDAEKRKIAILEILGFPPPYYDVNSCKQELMSDIGKLLRYGYYHNDSGIGEIIKDSPVKAVWNLRECTLQNVEHVDQRDLNSCKKIQILWPVLTDGEEVIEKGVVWDEK